MEQNREYLELNRALFDARHFMRVVAQLFGIEERCRCGERFVFRWPEGHPADDGKAVCPMCRSRAAAVVFRWIYDRKLHEQLAEQRAAMSALISGDGQGL